MATAAQHETYPHIVKSRGVRGGKACIDGTRIAVRDIVVLHQQGMPVEEMLTYYSRPLTPAEVYAALAYYYDHTSEIEAEFAADDDAEKRHEANLAEFASRGARR